MINKVNKKKRSKFTMILLSPVMILAFLLGWTLYFFGQNSYTKTSNQKAMPNASASSENVELIVVPLQEQICNAN